MKENFITRRIVKQHRLNYAWKLYYSGQKLAAIAWAEPLLSKTKYAYEANFLTGMAHYKTKKYNSAIPFFQTCAKLKNIRHDWYNLAMSFVQTNQTEEAEVAFHNISKGKEQSNYKSSTSYPEMLLQFAQLLYIKKEHKKAFQYINELKGFYAGLRKTEDNYLQSRGMPHFPMFLKFAMPIIEASNTAPTTWLSQFSKHLDTEGKKMCEAYS